MTAWNIVRFRAKSGQEQAFIEAHKRATLTAAGFRRAALVATSEHGFCFVGEWDDVESIVQARPAMIAILDTFRDTLEDLGEGLGLTDPVSGPELLELRS